MMSKKSTDQHFKSMVVFQAEPTECPFREFRDNELAAEFWGLGPAAFRATVVALMNKTSSKPPADHIWVDEQTQPLPRSVRQFLHGWIRAEELASSRWDAEVIIFEENDGGKMNIMDTQLSHAQVLLRSSFCRQVLAACFMLERAESVMVEHQWENFIFALGLEGWRAKYHIYSPGLKPGGGQQHRPGLSKNGCYLVRLFYLGAWRCVWVSDQVPVDATGAPLLPFSPLLSNAPALKSGVKQVPTTVTATVVYLWSLLLCKALLKLAAPDLNSDEETDNMEDEVMPEFNILHSLTGGMSLTYHLKDPEELWKKITAEVQVFGWDDDDDTLTSTMKSKSTKKTTNRETAVVRQRESMSFVVIEDTKNLPVYHLPGITPGHEMSLLITMARDLPLKKPLPEPEVAMWKYYRWVDWARGHGLYEAYDCPRTRFLKVNGLLKLSYSPHLLDVPSTESITVGFREEHEKSLPTPVKSKAKETKTSATAMPSAAQQLKEELREWIQFEPLQQLVKSFTVVYYPSVFEFTSAANSPPIRVTKGVFNKSIDIPAPKSAPLYLQIDGPVENNLKLSLHMLHPRVLFNAGVPIADYIEPAYLVLESFEWFVDCNLPVPKAYIRTKGYDSVEVTLKPGRHFCRIWVHSRMNWHLMLLSESSLLLGSRDVIQAAAVHECPWASKFLSALGLAFTNWIKINRSNTNVLQADREFYRSYQPDLEWDKEVVGYDRCHLHWMFRQALQSLLQKRLLLPDYRNVCAVLRRYFCDPEFGLPKKPVPTCSVRDIASLDPCDCLMPEAEETITEEELAEEQAMEERPVVDPSIMDQLLQPPRIPAFSQVCELATEEVPCGVLKHEREKMIKKHEAATILQAHWKGKWARKCLNSHVTFTPEILKIIHENAFGSLESQSALMNEFFGMYPGAKYAYSVASALSGVYGLQQHHGTTHITPKCKWIPYFQGVFFCHQPVKVHFDVQSTLSHSTVAIYDNDTGEQMPQSFGAHITFDFHPNLYGYTIMGHSTLNQTSSINYEAHWQLTVLSSIDGVFHVCDNDDPCHEAPLPPATKLHIDEMYLPNRRNILGGVQLSVTKHEAVSFRASATSPDLKMVATLRTLDPNGEMQEISQCSGNGEIHWPYIRLKPNRGLDMTALKKKSTSHSNMYSTGRDSGLTSTRSLKAPRPAIIKQVGTKGRSITKFKTTTAEPKTYYIEVVAPLGWPLTLQHWRRVDEVRNTQEVRVDMTPKKVTKDKPSSAKEKDKDKVSLPVPCHLPEIGDAYIELECSLAVGGGAQARRDDERDLEFLAARKSWDANEPGRNLRGAQIRREFRTEFLEALPPPPSDSMHTITEEAAVEETNNEEEKKATGELTVQQGPTPATESGLLEMSMESEEEAKYLTMPEQLRDKFIPLYFLPFCMKEKNEDESVLVTPNMAEAAKKDRHARIDAALERMRELQLYNEVYMLGRQKNRCQLLEKLFVDAQWPQELQDAIEEREDAIAKETLMRTLSANKKKQESKKK